MDDHQQAIRGLVRRFATRGWYCPACGTHVHNSCSHCVGCGMRRPWDPDRKQSED